MATIDEIGGGGSSVRGCAVITYIQTYSTQFAPGDILFYDKKARKGVLERVVIKKIRMLNTLRTGGRVGVMYVDTYNALWNEDELISHSEALQLAEDYYEFLLEEAAKLKKC